MKIHEQHVSKAKGKGKRYRDRDSHIPKVKIMPAVSPADKLLGDGVDIKQERWNTMEKEKKLDNVQMSFRNICRIKLHEKGFPRMMDLMCGTVDR